MTSGLDSLIDIGLDILSTTIDKTTNRILAFLGDAKAQRTTSNGAQWVQHVGIATRPRKAEPGKAAAQCVRVRRSDRDIVIGSTDSRTQEMYGALDDGESAFFASDGQARIILKKDGGAHVYTRAGNTAGGAGMVVQLDAANNAVRVLNGLGFGLIADANGVTITSGKAGLTLGADGSIKLIGTAQTQVDGSSVVLGSVVVPVANAALHGPSGLAGIASVKVSIE